MAEKRGPICYDCAVARGAKLKLPGLVTCWRGICPSCNAEKFLTSDRDFDWPEDTRES
jgi:hypothetical protein